MAILKTKNKTTGEWEEIQAIKGDKGDTGPSEWGVITGSISNQTDLKNALDGKANTTDLSTVATSGSYNDLSNKPTIPDELSDLSDDATHRLVTDTEKSTWNAKSNFSGSYNDLTNKPTIPTKVSDLSNDTGFIVNTVNNLTNYYTKTNTYTKSEVDSLIGAVSSLNIEIVSTLPTHDISTSTIYLVPKTASTNDNYDEYIYVSNNWEHIGSTEIDLSDYVTDAELTTALQGKLDFTSLTTPVNIWSLSDGVYIIARGDLNDATNNKLYYTQNNSREIFNDNVLLIRNGNNFTYFDGGWVKGESYDSGNHGSIFNVLTTYNITNSLTSTSTDFALSANQGKELNDKKQNKLVSGTNIKTINNESILSSGNLSLQETLVSGTSIKTINNESLLGSGNITITPGPSGGGDYEELANKPSINSINLVGNKTSSDLGLADADSVMPYYDEIPSAGIVDGKINPYYLDVGVYRLNETKKVVTIQGYAGDFLIISPNNDDSGKKWILNGYNGLWSGYSTSSNHSYSKMISTDNINNYFKIYYGTCSTSSDTQTKVVTCSDWSSVLSGGEIIYIKFTNSNTYNGTAKLNINDTGAKNITGTSRYRWAAGEVVGFVYNSYDNNYTMLEAGVASVTDYGVTKLSNETNSTSVSLAATAGAVKKAYDLADSKQDALVSGTNIKTINSTSLLGSGDISTFSGNYNDLTNKPTIPTKTSDLTNDSGFTTFSGDYDDLTNKPTIPSEVTESTVSGWGFTKNTGTYSKPSGGIPKTDLASAVQTSLGKADTALQSFTETDPVFTASAAHGISSSDITSWNGKQAALVSGTNIKTINNESLLGSGNITVVATETDPVFSGSPAANILTSDLTNWNNKQDALVSGTNIKTINSQSIVGSGNVDFYGTELPIGTEAYYDGSSAPTGWQEVDDYSTSEVNTGKKWIDGKTIYRKVYTGTLASNISHGLSGVTFVNAYGFYVSSTGTFLPLPSLRPTNTQFNVGFYVTSSAITFEKGTSAAGDVCVILEYTKN